MSILSELKLPCSAFSAAAGAGGAGPAPRWGRAAGGAGPGTAGTQKGHGGDTGSARHGAVRQGLGRGRHPAPQPACQRAQVPPAGAAGPLGAGGGLSHFLPSHLVPSLRAPVRFRPAPASLSRDFCTAHYSHGARAAPSEGAWISLCKLRAELRRNFCSFL